TPGELLDHVTFARSEALPPITWAVSVTEPPTPIWELAGETRISIACDGASRTLAFSGSAGQATNVNVLSTITTRTNPRGVPRVNRCCAMTDPLFPNAVRAASERSSPALPSRH